MFTNNHNTKRQNQQSEKGARPFEEQPLAQEIKLQGGGVKFVIKKLGWCVDLLKRYSSIVSVPGLAFSYGQGIPS
jgi:hypothetical protein